MPTEAPTQSCAYRTGDVAWVMTATVLVLGMIPGLAFFESGMLRRKNSVSIITQTLGGLVLLACLWVVVGYTLTFGRDAGGVIGGLEHALFIGVAFDDCVLTGGVTHPVPTAVFAIFQMMFACVTPLLITGTVAERMRWQPYLLFMLGFEVFVYYPVAHWVWGGGWLGNLGTQDFAGGIVIHTSSGCASIVAALMLGRRIDYDQYIGGGGEFPHSDVRMAVIGASLLWCGWFGFNAGSALEASPVAIHAVVNTQIGACFSGAIWFLSSWASQKPSALALINGAVAGMAGITPACGYISTQAAVVLAIVLALASKGAAHLLRHARIDDALEVSAVHGMTGVVGSVAIGLCASRDVNPGIADGLFYGGGAGLLGAQCAGVAAVGAYSAVVSWALLALIRLVMPLRARPEHETEGLDYWHHRLDVVHVEEGLTAEESLSTAEQRYPPGTRVVHPKRGAGVVSDIDLTDARNKPFLVAFDSGEVHHYSSESVLKLTVKDEVSRTNSKTLRKSSLKALVADAEAAAEGAGARRSSTRLSINAAADALSAPLLESVAAAVGGPDNAENT